MKTKDWLLLLIGVLGAIAGVWAFYKIEFYYIVEGQKQAGCLWNSAFILAMSIVSSFNRVLLQKMKGVRLVLFALTMPTLVSLAMLLMWLFKHVIPTDMDKHSLMLLLDVGFVLCFALFGLTIVYISNQKETQK